MNIQWDFGELEAHDPTIQRRLGMSMNQIMHTSHEAMHKKLCTLFGLPTKMSEGDSVKSLEKYYRRPIVCTY